MTHNQVSSAQQENDEVHDANDLNEDSENEETELFTENAKMPGISTPVIPDDDLNLRILSTENNISFTY